MAKVLHRSFGVSSPVQLARARLDARLPHGRRHGEVNSFNPMDVLRAWQRRRATRRELRRMDDNLLRDAGLDPDRARREARRPFWRPLAIRRDERR